MLKINNVSLQKKRNKKEVSILRDISFEIPRSRISLLLGKSGSGKTTLLRCISQLEKDYQGEITCEGKELGAISPKERCRLIGFVPQSYALFPNKNVLDNCEMPCARCWREQGVRLQKSRRGIALARYGKLFGPVSSGAFGRPAAARSDRAGACSRSRFYSLR